MAPSPTDPASEPPSRTKAVISTALLVLALIPATWGQIQLMDQRGVGWFGSLAGLIMAIVAARMAGAPANPWREPPRDPRLVRRWWMLVPAVLFGLLAWWFQLGEQPREPVVLIFWLLAIAYLLIPSLIPERGSFKTRVTDVLRTARTRWSVWLTVALLMGTALTFRLPHLERYPVAVHNDEASCGLMGQQVLERRAAGERHWFRTCEGFWHFPSVGFFPSAVGQALTGTNLYGHRLANVVLSTLALGCFYSLVRSMLGTTAALLALAVAATAHVAVHWSRSGIHSGHAAWLTVICAWLVWKAVSTGRLQWFVLSGLALPLGFLTYSAAYVVPLWLGLVLAIAWLASSRFRRALTVPLAVAFLSTVVFSAPFVAEFQNHPETFFNRSNMMVWTEEQAAVNHMRASYGEDFRRVMLARNWERTTRLLHLEGDSNLQYGNRGIGLMDWMTAVVFVLGLGVALAWLRHPAHWPLLLVLLLNVALGGVLAMDGVQYSRLAGIAVIMAVVPALWGRQLMESGRAALGRWAVVPIAAALIAGVLAVGLENHSYTFNRHDDVSWTDGSLRLDGVRATIARNTGEWGGGNFTFVQSDLPSDFGHQAYRLISSHQAKAEFDSVDVIDLSVVDEHNTVTFVIPPGAEEVLHQLEARFPGGRKVPIEIEFHDPNDVAWVYRISNSAD
jgi:4-amino-4-deoxy-L-arabinose transferase-like glycosyltransferase